MNAQHENHERSPISRPSEKVVTQAYERLSNAAVQGQVNQSLDKLAQLIGVSRTTAQKAIQALIDEGKIRRIQTGPNQADVLEITGPGVEDPLVGQSAKLVSVLDEIAAQAPKLFQSYIERNKLLEDRLREYEQLFARRLSHTTDPITGTEIMVFRMTGH